MIQITTRKLLVLVIGMFLYQSAAFSADVDLTGYTHIGAVENFHYYVKDVKTSSNTSKTFKYRYAILSPGWHTGDYPKLSDQRSAEINCRDKLVLHDIGIQWFLPIATGGDILLYNYVCKDYHN